MLSIKILLFATLRDAAGGRKSIQLDLPEGAAVRDLKRRAVEQFPTLQKPMQSVLVAVNREFATDETLLDGQAEVALFPPVSGG